MVDFAARDVPRSVGTRIVSARRPRCPGARGCENPPVPDSLRPSYPPPLLGRRRLLRTSVLALAAGALGAGTLGGCGGIALGGPEEYTPPPPGIDDLYRRDLLALLERAIAGAEALTSTSSGGDPALAADLT